MQFIRTAIWILITAIMVAFVAMNWETVTIRFWPEASGGYRTFDAPGGLIALIFYFLGLLPAWAYYRGVRWRLTRKIASLEDDLQAAKLEAATAAAASPPAAGVSAEAASEG